jgi:hypothetical protein
MRFLVDANLSPRVATLLSGEGFESIHFGDVDLLSALIRPSWIMRRAMLETCGSAGKGASVQEVYLPG